MTNSDRSPRALRQFYEAKGSLVHRQRAIYEVGDRYLMALGRRRLQIVRDWLARIKAEDSISSFCDIGTSEGLYLGIAKGTFGEQILAVGGDIALSCLKKAKAGTNCEVFLGDAQNLPFRDNSFDIVLCSEVLEHLPNPQSAFSELARISKRFVIVSTPGDTLLKRIYRILTWRKGKMLKPKDLAHDPGHISYISIKDIRHWASNFQLNVNDIAVYGTLGTEVPKILKLSLFLHRGLDNLFSQAFAKAGLHELSLGRVVLLEKDAAHSNLKPAGRM